MFDLVITNGTVVDGTGAAPRRADVAIEGERIVAVGLDLGPARRTIDATGLIVTPGWVDIHTHYDGQVTWDPDLAPSSTNGVTSLVIGNCGVGFAPVQPTMHDDLISLLEGVEDIPGTALAEGLSWEWESFPEFLDALERREWPVDIGTQYLNIGCHVWLAISRCQKRSGRDRSTIRITPITSNSRFSAATSKSTAVPWPAAPAVSAPSVAAD